MNHRTDEFICIIADAAAYKKWLGGDKTVPLVEIVDCKLSNWILQ
jgi:hypothetical protein